MSQGCECSYKRCNCDSCDCLSRGQSPRARAGGLGPGSGLLTSSSTVPGYEMMGSLEL